MTEQELKEFDEDFQAALAEHEAEVAACGGSREWLHIHARMTYEEVDAFQRRIEEMVQTILKEIHGDV